jgi:hypothetical protein
MTSLRPSSLLLLLALSSAGCATPGLMPGKPAAERADVTVVMDGKGCPVSVTINPARTCGAPSGSDCVAARPGAFVSFASSNGKPFTIYFDPFKRGALHAADGTGRERIDPAAPFKGYTYNVEVTGCPILDPTIIVRGNAP